MKMTPALPLQRRSRISLLTLHLMLVLLINFVKGVDIYYNFALDGGNFNINDREASDGNQKIRK